MYSTTRPKEKTIRNNQQPNPHLLLLNGPPHIFGPNFGQIFDQIFGQVFDQGFGDPEIQCTVLLGQKIQCTVLLVQKIQ